MAAALIAEIVLTMFFLIVILGSTPKKATAGFVPIAIGLCLTLNHLIGIPAANLLVISAGHRENGLAEGEGDASKVDSNIWKNRRELAPPPKNVNQNLSKNSAPHRFDICIRLAFLQRFLPYNEIRRRCK